MNERNEEVNGATREREAIIEWVDTYSPALHAIADQARAIVSKESPKLKGATRISQILKVASELELPNSAQSIYRYANEAAPIIAAHETPMWHTTLQGLILRKEVPNDTQREQMATRLAKSLLRQAKETPRGLYLCTTHYVFYKLDYEQVDGAVGSVYDIYFYQLKQSLMSWARNDSPSEWRAKLEEVRYHTQRETDESEIEELLTTYVDKMLDFCIVFNKKHMMGISFDDNWRMAKYATTHVHDIISQEK